MGLRTPAGESRGGSFFAGVRDVSAGDGGPPGRNVRAGFTSLANTYIIRGRIYTWRTIMIKNKFMALTLTVVLTAGMLTGCGSGDKEKDKDAYRQYGINCICLLYTSDAADD